MSESPWLLIMSLMSAVQVVERGGGEVDSRATSGSQSAGQGRVTSVDPALLDTPTHNIALITTLYNIAHYTHTSYSIAYLALLQSVQKSFEREKVSE